MAYFVTESSQGRVPLPSKFGPSMFTIGAFDNFDHEENTLSGIGGSHDTVSILTQDSKPNMSETHVTHRERQFKEEMGCQVLHNYIKPAKKPTLHTWYELPKDVYVIGASELQLIRTKYIAWLLGRLDISDLDHIINETNEEQTMPSWSAFNSLITDEHVTKKNIGFLSGSFHLIKLVMGAIGKYIDGSGAETILAESKAYGENVVRSVMDGSHYILLSECIGRFQCAEFFKKQELHPTGINLNH